MGQGSSLQLSSALVRSIPERSAPLSMQPIKRLRKGPMDLDVDAGMAHRLFHLAKPSNASWRQFSGQFGHAYAGLRRFRRFFLDSLERVRGVFADAKLSLMP